MFAIDTTTEYTCPLPAGGRYTPPSHNLRIRGPKLGLLFAYSDLTYRAKAHNGAHASRRIDAVSPHDASPGRPLSRQVGGTTDDADATSPPAISPVPCRLSWHTQGASSDAHSSLTSDRTILSPPLRAVTAAAPHRLAAHACSGSTLDRLLSPPSLRHRARHTSELQRYGPPLPFIALQPP